MTRPSELTAKFAEAFEAFDVLDEQPTDVYVSSIFEVLSSLLYVVEYDEVEATHNLIGLIQDDEPYKQKCDKSFACPARPKISDDTLDESLAVSIKTRKAAAKHSAKRSD